MSRARSCTPARWHTARKSGSSPTRASASLLCSYVSIRQRASAYVSCSYVSIRQQTQERQITDTRYRLSPLLIRQHTSASVSIHQHVSACVSMRQHTSACVSIRQHTSAYERLCVNLQMWTSTPLHAASLQYIKALLRLC
jgi:hypothetical protein